ncbi:MAG: hypothetical protein WCI18_09685 [Pseudomonadota bacterium]
MEKYKDLCFFKPGADFSFWWSQDAVSIEKAVILSFGDCLWAACQQIERLDYHKIEPDTLNRLDQYRNRTKLAIADMKSNSGKWKNMYFITDSNGNENLYVSLHEFRLWLKDKNLPMDRAFEIYNLSPSQVKEGGEGITLPYKNKFMSALAETMWDQYGPPQDRKKPQQKFVIDHLVEKHGIGERTAVSIAAAIQPSGDEEVSEQKVKTASKSKSKAKPKPKSKKKLTVSSR